jgi:hypothetical protein
MPPELSQSEGSYVPGPEPDRVRLAPVPGPGRHRQDGFDEPEGQHDSRWWLVLHVAFISLWAAVLVVLVARLLAIYLRLPDQP